MRKELKELLEKENNYLIVSKNEKYSSEVLKALQKICNLLETEKVVVRADETGAIIIEDWNYFV